MKDEVVVDIGAEVRVVYDVACSCIEGQILLITISFTFYFKLIQTISFQNLSVSVSVTVTGRV